MSKKRDYTRYSKESAEIKEPVAEVEEIVVEEPKIEEVTVEESEPIIGIVTDCTKLNVREQPSKTADILGVISAATELVIIEEESTEDYYKICTSAGLEGYCMKKFITIMP